MARPNAKDACPCGSGKRYKHCHGPADRARRQRALVGLLAAASAILLLAVAWSALRARQAATPRPARGAAGAQAPAAPTAAAAAGGAAGANGAAGDSGRPVLGTQGPDGLVRAPLPDPNSLTFRPPNSGELAPGEHPRPWEYDVAHNRYYDPRPGHRHWHAGQPPADTTGLGQAPVVIVTTPVAPAPAAAPKSAVKR